MLPNAYEGTRYIICRTYPLKHTLNIQLIAHSQVNKKVTRNRNKQVAL